MESSTAAPTTTTNTDTPDEQQSADKLARAILELEGDPAFQKLHRELTKTNFFRILGSSNSETWHSSFWGWIFDPEGSHDLGSFAARRLLSLATADETQLRCTRVGRKHGENNGWALERSTEQGRTELNLSDLMSFRVEDSVAVPGRRTGHSEVGIDFSNFPDKSWKNSRFDILLLLQAPEFDSDFKNDHINILVGVECKVDARYRPEQLRKYSRWLHDDPRPDLISDKPVRKHFQTITDRIQTNPGGIFSFGFFLAKNRPEDRHNRPAPESLDQPWTSITYNTLIEYILEPMLEHPRLDVAADGLVRQYIEMSGSPTSEIFTGSTQMHKQLVEELLDRHEETFLAIATVLEERDDTQEIASTLNKALELDGERAKSLTPQDLIAHGFAEPNDRLVHEPMKKRALDNEKPFEEKVIAEIVEHAGDGSGRSSLRWVEGGGVEIEGLHSAYGLLKDIYKANDTSFTANGNAYWKFESGEYKGQSLVEVYDQCREVMSE